MSLWGTLSLACLRSAVLVHLAASSAPGCAGGTRHMSLRGVLSLGASTGPRRASALGCHLHERNRGRPPCSSRGAAIIATHFCYPVGGSGHSSWGTCFLARLSSVPRLCTWPPPRRRAARAGAGMSLRSIFGMQSLLLGHAQSYSVPSSASTGPRRASALGCHLHERGRGRPPCSSLGAAISATHFCYPVGGSGHSSWGICSLARLRSVPRLCTWPLLGAGLRGREQA